MTAVVIGNQLTLSWESDALATTAACKACQYGVISSVTAAAVIVNDFVANFYFAPI